MIKVWPMTDGSQPEIEMGGGIAIVDESDPDSPKILFEIAYNNRKIIISGGQEVEINGTKLSEFLQINPQSDHTIEVEKKPISK